MPPPPSLCASCWAVKLRELFLDWEGNDRTGQDSFGSKTSVGDPGSEDCSADWLLELKSHSMPCSFSSYLLASHIFKLVIQLNCHRGPSQRSLPYPHLNSEVTVWQKRTCGHSEWQTFLCLSHPPPFSFTSVSAALLSQIFLFELSCASPGFYLFTYLFLLWQLNYHNHKTSDQIKDHLWCAAFMQSS